MRSPRECGKDRRGSVSPSQDRKTCQKERGEAGRVQAEPCPTRRHFKKEMTMCCTAESAPVNRQRKYVSGLAIDKIVFVFLRRHLIMWQSLTERLKFGRGRGLWRRWAEAEIKDRDSRLTCRQKTLCTHPHTCRGTFYSSLVLWSLDTISYAFLICSTVFILIF